MARPVPWKPLAIVTSISTVLLSLLLLPACCCVKGPLAPITPAAAPVVSAMGAGEMPTPSEAASKAPTQALMRNVWFHIDQDAYLDIHEMRGELVSNTPGAGHAAELRQQAVIRVEGRYRHDRYAQRQSRRADEPLHLRVSQSAVAQSAHGDRREAAQAERDHA
jgi:hypothetical protein